jgi:UDP-N-acetyl-D-mannosaminuronic acid dehydrogenase
MQSESFDVCVVGGAGHIGLPFALVLASKGLDVAIYDIDQAALDVIAAGRVPFIEDGAEALLADAIDRGNLHLSSQAQVAGQASTLVVIIGTDVDRFTNPDLDAVRACFEDLLPHLRDDQHIILRSTVFPGTTDWLAGWLADHGVNPMISCCPERVLQGKAIEELQSLPQVISGTSAAAVEAAEAFFARIGAETVRLAPMEAEFAKLFSNAYRYISFAIANQFYMITSSAGVDYDRIMRAVKHNYPRLQGLPSAGYAAGPCLFKDTMQLNAFAKNQFQLGQAAMNVNEGLVLHVVGQMEQQFDLANMTVGLLGMAFKADIDDIRSSLSYKFKRLLQFKTKQVLTTDPYVTVDPELKPLEDVIEKSDVLVLCAPHRQYRDLQLDGKPVVDVWGYLGQGTLVPEGMVA